MSICFLLIFSSLCSQTRVIGGKEIDIEDAPWTANMRVINSAGIRLFDRSGIIISENLILTASHNWPDYEYDHLEVHVGGASEGVGQYCKVHKCIHHPDKDITLLELSEPLRFGKNIQAIDYKSCADESLYAPGTSAVLYGWGRTIPDSPSQSLRLRAVNVRIISYHEANNIYGAFVVSANNIASIGETTIGMGGKGDSGGPLVVFDNQQNPALVGVAIYADIRNEAENSGLTVYSKVKPIIEWLDSLKCEIIGPDTVSPLGASFGITNIPPDVVSIEWTYSGLIEISSTMDCIDVISSEIEGEATGHISATITTNLGTLTVYKKLVIMPRIDVNISIEYNKNTSKYEMTAKAINMETIDDKDILACMNIKDHIKLMGFVWTYDKNIAIGHEAIFEINPNSPKLHTIGVRKYNCDYTIRLEKTFVIHHDNNELLTVHNEPGTISIESTGLSVDIETSEKLELIYIKDTMANSVLLSTSDVTVTNLLKETVKAGNYKISLYSRAGNLLYSRNFNSNEGAFHINTATFYSDIYILHIYSPDTGKVISRQLIIY